MSNADVVVPRYQPSTTVMGVAGAVGVLGLGYTAYAVSQDAARGMLSYTLGWAYWFTIAFGSLIQILTFRASAARWVIGIRRMIEVFATGVGPMLLLVLPIFAMLGKVYPLVDHPAVKEGLNDPTIFKNTYLSPTFMMARVVGVLGFGAIVAELLLRWSQGLNDTPNQTLVTRMIRLGSGAMPILFLGGTFVAFDTLMSLEPGWGSTMFGAYVLTGGYLGAMAMAIIATHQLNRPGQLQGYVTPTQLHNMGKLMFAAICFWTYVSVSQYLLIWIANLPEEIGWMKARIYSNATWSGVFYSLIFLHFFVPFLLLLPKAAKTVPWRVTAMAAFMMVMHLVDVSWIILPSKRDTFYVLSDVTAVLGVGGVYIAYLCFRLRNQQVAPKGDPDFAVHSNLQAAH